MEKILKRPLSVVVKTSKIVATDKNRKPVYENMDIPITLNDWYNWVKYANMHGFESVEVIGIVKDGKELTGDKLGKEDKELVNKYQAELEKVMKPKVSENADINSQLESQKQANAELLKRLEALEKGQIKNENNIQSGERDLNKAREILENKANEMNISFRNNISSEKLLEKIQEKMTEQEFLESGLVSLL